MKSVLFVCWLVGLVLLLESSAGQRVTYVGRVHESSTVSGAVEFEWSNIEIHYTFKGKAIEALLVSNQNVFEVFLDGVSVGLINTTSSQRQYTLAKDLSSGKAHSLVLRKRTEALFGLVYFRGFAVAGNDPDDVQFVPAIDEFNAHTIRQDERRIEFIGDSISCGYGNEGHPPCPFTAATENSGLTYGALVAKSLGAQLHLECWSGRGVVRNYGDHNITSAEPFPVLFPRTLPTDKTSQWHFGVWTPQAVVINLGTNDYSTQPQPPQNVFEDGYLRFIEYIHQQYTHGGSSPHFFLVCGPMISQPCCSYVQNVVAKERSRGLNITYIDMQHLLNSDDIGCAGHPSVSGHKKMAGVALPVIKSAMGW